MTTARTSISRQQGVALALELLRLVATRRMAPDPLAEALGISRASLYRLRTQVERDYGVWIEYADGRWRVADWGVFRRAQVLARSDSPGELTSATR